MKGRRGLPCRRQRLEQDVEALDRDDAADEEQKDVIVAQAHLGAQRDSVAATSSRAASGVEVEAEGNDGEPVPGGDAEAHQVVDGRLADADEAVAETGHAALELAVDPGLRGAEVALEDVAVVGVDYRRPGTDRERRLAAQKAGLGRVGVDDVRLEVTRDADQLEQGARVPRGVHGLLQRGDEAHRGALLFGEVGERGLAAGMLPCTSSVS